MNSPSLPLELLSTGIPGLDRVLGGGFPAHGIYMIEGPPGAGKTILGNQLCYHHAGQGRQAIYLTLLIESHSRMISHLRRLSFFRADLVAKNLHYISGFKTLETEDLGGLLRTIRETVTARQATLLVLDGLVSALESASVNRNYKKFVHELQIIAAIAQCTVLILASTDPTSKQRPEHTMVDGIIELTDDLDQLRSFRHLRVRKLRGAAPVRGQHTLSITNDGISVRPRIEADLLRLPEDARVIPGSNRINFGVQGLDEMLHGGLVEHSNTMLIGPSGVGKTMLGLQFLTAGARKGETGVYFGFYERPKTLAAKGDRIGLAVSELVESGRIRLLWEPFGEGSIDSLGERMLSTVRELRPARLFVDGLHGFEQSADVPQRLGSVFSAITEALETQQVTAIYTMETPDLLGPMVTNPIRGVSAITHNIILLRYTELDAKVHRLISVLKLRDSGHDPRLRQLGITDSGISISDPFDGAEDILSGEARRSIATVERVKQQATGPLPRAERSHGTSGAILIVDDEFGLADVLAEILSERGYQTSIAINGELGLQSLREQRPDLVLLDVMMPVVDGAEMLERMATEPAFARIPVVLMTALPEAVSKETAARCEAVLQKPFAPERLFEIVERILNSEGSK